MRFKDQVRWSRKWGAILLLLGGLSFGALYLLAENGKRDLALSLANFCTALVGMAAVLILFGGLMRPLQKLMYQKVIFPNDYWRKRVIVNPVWRLWVWIDKNGKDRDA